MEHSHAAERARDQRWFRFIKLLGIWHCSQTHAPWTYRIYYTNYTWNWIQSHSSRTVTSVGESQKRGRARRDSGAWKNEREREREREEGKRACNRKETQPRPSYFLIVFDDSPLDGPTWPLIRPAGDLPSAALGNCNSGLRIQGGVISLPCECRLGRGARKVKIIQRITCIV